MQPPELTDRERTILRLIYYEHKNRLIAQDEAGLSKSVRRKAEHSGLTKLVCWYLENVPEG